MGELLKERLGLEHQVKDMGSGEPLKVLELRSDVCTGAFRNMTGVCALAWKSKHLEAGR